MSNAKYLADRPSSAKDRAAFIDHADGCLETRPEYLDSFITPNELFFVRNNGTSPHIDVQHYKLRIEGDAIENPLELSLSEIFKLPVKSLLAYLECAGNHRSFFESIMGQPTEDTQWKTGGVGMAEWTGVSLSDVLAQAKPRADAVDVQFIGLDEDAPEGGFRRVIPFEKAMDPNTLLAYGMNGRVLPVDHGYPLRAIVPGWVGSSSIKWLGRIVVSSERLWSRNNTDSYVMIGPDYPRDGEALGQVATHQTIKSALALPWAATLDSGLLTLRGFAHSAHAPIDRVEWSVNGGASWQDAELLEPRLKYAWSRFTFTWQAEPGEYTIMTRATDAAGNTQPDVIPFNEKGYLFNCPLPHPIKIV